MNILQKGSYETLSSEGVNILYLQTLQFRHKKYVQFEKKQLCRWVRLLSCHTLHFGDSTLAGVLDF